MIDLNVIIFGVAILVAFLLLLVTFFAANKLRNMEPSPCPYTGGVLRRCSDLSYFMKEQILRYLFFMRQYDNRIFDLEKSTFCRDTFRIFPGTITWYGVERLDWNFLAKRYPGNWVSWGSLSDLQQQAIREAHHKIEGYQMEISCPYPAPNQITKEYAYTIPGPLYVDLETGVLLGWKVVPDTEFEVLIVTKPKGTFEEPKR